MATVGNLLDYIAERSGQSKTAASADRTQHLVALNDANNQLVERTGVYHSSFSKSLTSGTGDYTIGTSPLDVSGVNRIVDLWVTQGAGQRVQSKVVSVGMLGGLRQANTSSGHTVYIAVAYPKVFLWPAPADGYTLNGIFESAPLPLVESGATPGTNESTPTAIPAPFHYSALGNLATAITLEYARRDGSWFRGLADAAADKLADWADEVASFKGSNYLGPDDDGAPIIGSDAY